MAARRSSSSRRAHWACVTDVCLVNSWRFWWRSFWQQVGVLKCTSTVHVACFFFC